jgi:dihydropteroate synthase
MKSKHINIKGQLYPIDRPLVMGILNVTSDSFFDGGKYLSREDIAQRVKTIVDEGGDIIDIGAYSSRPGADDISEEEEWKRLKTGIEVTLEVCREAIISVDTFRSTIARKAIEAGATIINDISGGDMDPLMFLTIAELNVPYILMHMQGTPQNMQDKPEYKDIINDIILDISDKTDRLRMLGVKDIIIDPGFGFGKTTDDNFQLLKYLEKMSIFELPILVGVSRKSMIYKTIGSTPEGSLNGTTTLNTIALSKGAKILRVHDVKEAVECVRLYERCYHS